MPGAPAPENRDEKAGGDIGCEFAAADAEPEPEGES